MVQIEESRQEYMKQNGIPPGVPTQKGQNIEPEITGVALPNAPLGNYDVPDGWPTPPHFNEKGDVPGPPLQWEEPEDLGNVEAGYGYKSNNEEENDIFFFHSDHLGSTSYLTDKDGNACEYVCYMPYGESIVDENNTDDQNIYKFTGKELDRETGQYYFEQRYYNPFDARFTSIDPHFENYPFLSPYNYCNSNPMRFIDPTGMDWYSFTDEDGNKTFLWKAGKAESFDYQGKIYTNVGATLTTNKYYYSLFGNYAKIGSKEESMLKSMDKAIEFYAQYEVDSYKEALGLSGSLEPTKEPTTSFYLKNDSQNNIFEFEYAKGKGVFHVYSDSKNTKGKIYQFPSSYSEQSGFFSSKKGYFLNIRNSQGSNGGLDIVNLEFSKEKAIEFMNNYHQQFPEVSKYQQLWKQKFLR